MNTKTRKIIGYSLTGLIGFILTASGLFKLSGGNEELIAAVGSQTNLMGLGLLELCITLLLIPRKTGKIGVYLAMCYMAGAIAVHFVALQPIATTVSIEILIWVCGYFRYPELFSSKKIAD